MSSTSSTTLSARPFNRSPPTKSGITSSTSSGSAAIQHPDRLKTPSKKNTIAGSRTPTSIFKPHHPAPSAGGPIAATLYVDHYNTMRLHSAIGYVTPQDRLAGRQAEIHVARDRKLEAARSQRQLRRQQTAPSKFAHSSTPVTMTSPGETEAGTAGMQPC
jgi:hypothetical protein